MFAVEMWNSAVRDEELACVGILALIRHAEYTSGVVPLRSFELVFKRLTPYTLSASSSACRVTALYHEALDIPVKDGVAVVSLLCQLDKVPYRARRVFGEEFDVKVAE